MLSIILRITRICLALLLASAATSCKMDIELPNRVSGNGNIITEKRETHSSFSKIYVSNAFEVEVLQANEFEVVVKADDNLIPHIITEVVDNTLKIKFENNLTIKTYKDIKIYVKMPRIDELKATASSSIDVKNTLNTDDLTLKTTSTGEIKLLEVNAKSLIAEASSSSEISIEKLYATEFKAHATSTADIEVEYLEADKIDVSASSSSDIEMKGKALDLIISASSTATVDAKELWANNVVVTASSSATAKVYPIVSLKAKASSTADVLYYKEPKTINKETSSSGKVVLR